MPLDEVMRDTTALGGLAVYGVVALLFLLLGNVSLFVTLAAGLVLCYAIISPMRVVFFRVRPDRQKFRGVFTKIDAGSFPSMHSTRATVLAIVLAQFFTQPAVRVLFVLSVLAVLVTRVLLKRHYVSDVIGGIAVGAVVGWVTLFLAPFVLGALGL